MSAFLTCCFRAPSKQSGGMIARHFVFRGSNLEVEFQSVVSSG